MQEGDLAKSIYHTKDLSTVINIAMSQKDILDISLIVPAYNSEKYIENCINSLLDQDLPKSKYEIIIINDGSTDGTAAILNRISAENENIRLINQENKGRHEARNIGASLANGRYIWFIDNDDFISSKCLKSIVQIADENSLDVFAVATGLPFMPVYYDTGISDVMGQLQTSV
jgi:glycosyltransferase involved in cell wall biosynthesis